MGRNRYELRLALRVMISILLIVMTILSFTNCVTVVHHKEFNPWSSLPSFGESRESAPFQESYSPVLFIVLSVIELFLIWIADKRLLSFLASVLNVIATVFPIWSRYTMQQWGEHPIMSDYFPAYNEYTYGVAVCVIIAMGATVFVTYIILFFLYEDTPAPKMTLGDFIKDESTRRIW
ncbi:MAG: hypothetical protein K5665_01345 [Saccharofermentans sp.]|nr:hypothetical protein [Saccharofermentans sp.]